MTAPAGDRAFLTSEPIKVLGCDRGQFLKQGRIEFPPRLRVSTRSRRETQLAQRAKDFVERILQGEFMATQNQYRYQRKGQDTVPSKSCRCRTKLRARLFCGELVSQTREKLEFVFLFMLLLLPINRIISSVLSLTKRNWRFNAGAEREGNRSR